MKGVFPQVVFRIGPVPIYDTVTSTWAAMALIVFIAWILGKRRPMALEMLLDFLSDLISSMMDRPASPYLPLLGTLFIFIAVANISGVLPAVATPTKDLNTPIALALVVFFSVHYFGAREQGLLGYMRQLASPIFMLPLEVISQVSRTISLSIRLFGNIISGEMIVAVIFSLIPLIVPLPVQLFTMFTGLLQAYIFTVLAAVYIGGAVEASNAEPQASATGESISRSES
jgi:F-type H+-transporting ATPase subunit a